MYDEEDGYQKKERRRRPYVRCAGTGTGIRNIMVGGVAILLAFGSATGDVFGAETTCTALVEEAYTFVYQGNNSPATVSSMLEIYRDRLRGCSETPVDGDMTFLIATIDHLQGRVAHNQGNHRSAEEKFLSVINDMEQLIDEENESSRVLRLLADTYIARADYKGKLYGMRIIRDVRRLLHEAVLLNPIDERAHVSLARYYLNAPSALGGDLDRAREHAEIARHSPEKAVRFDALILLSDIQQELGAISDSDDAITQAARIFPSNERVVERQ